MCGWEKTVFKNSNIGIAASDCFKNRIQSIFLSWEIEWQKKAWSEIEMREGEC